MTLPFRTLLSFALAFVMTAGVGSTAEAPISPADHETLVKPFIAQHCAKCHSAEKQSGDLRLDNLAVDYASPKVMGQWEEIMNRVSAGEMPPKREPRPSAADVARLVEWIAG